MKKLCAHRSQETRSGPMREERVHQGREIEYGMSMEEKFCGRKVTVETGYNKWGGRSRKYMNIYESATRKSDTCIHILFYCFQVTVSLCSLGIYLIFRPV